MPQSLFLCTLAILSLVFTIACENQQRTELANHSIYAAGTARVYLAESSPTTIKDLYLATDSPVEALTVCLENGSNSCGENQKFAAQAVGDRAGSHFFRLKGEMPLQEEKKYLVQDAAGATMLHFEIWDKNKPRDPIATGLKLITQSKIEQELGFLASDSMNGRLSGTDDNNQAADWIIEQLQNAGIKPARDSGYKQSFRMTVGPTAGQNTANIVAKIEGSDPTLKNEFIVIGAHMDHAGTLSRGYTCSRGASGSNPICNGADDNGSGSIAVLQVARSLQKVRSGLKRSVILIWFSGEEQGLLGSNHYVNRDPIAPINKTVYMINLDMVGYMNSFGNRLGALGGETSRQAAEAMRQIAQKYPGRSVSLTRQAGGGSDHVHFMRRGIPGVFFHTGVQNNRNYHRTSDTVDKIDFAGITVATKITFELAVKVAQDSAYSDGLGLTGYREPLVTEEEAKQTCHHLMKNPFIEELSLDFTDSNTPR